MVEKDLQDQEIVFDNAVLNRILGRTAGAGDFRVAAKDVDIEYMSSIHAGLFTGVLVGPYAFSPAR